MKKKSGGGGGGGTQDKLKLQVNESAVLGALNDPRFKWRTLGGIASQLHISETEVMDVIAKYQSKIIESSVPSQKGKSLYTTREHYIKKTSGFNRMLGSLVGRAL